MTAAIYEQFHQTPSSFLLVPTLEKLGSTRFRERVDAAESLLAQPVLDAEACREQVVKQLRKEKHLRALARLQSLALRLGVHDVFPSRTSLEDRARRREFFEAQITKKLPDILQSASLPALKWGWGEELDERELEVLMSRMVLEELGFRDPFVTWLRPVLDDTTCAQFAKALVEHWARSSYICDERSLITSSGDADQKWVVFAQGELMDDARVDEIGPLLDTMAANGYHGLATWNIEALCRNASKRAVRWIVHWVLHSRRRSVVEASKQAIGELARERGVTPVDIMREHDPFVAEEVFEKNLPLTGFEHGPMKLDFGSRTITVSLPVDTIHAHDLVLTNDKGRVYTKIPRGSKRDSAPMVDRAVTRYKDLKATMKQVVPRICQHVEHALIHGREWSARAFVKTFFGHLIARRIMQTMVCEVAGRLARFDGESWLTSDFEELDVCADEHVRLVHPLELTEDERAAWSEHLCDAMLVQHVEQLARMRTIEPFVPNTEYAPSSSMTRALTECGWWKIGTGKCYDVRLVFPYRGVSARVYSDAIEFSTLGGALIDDEDVDDVVLGEVRRVHRRVFGR